MSKFEIRFFLTVILTVALITIAGWARADSGIVKGPSLSFGGKAKDRTCQIVERVDPETGKVTRKVECKKGK